MSLDVEGAVRVALRLLEAEGLDKLTVRRLATELGVKAPALYWHFRSKRALLDHLTDAIVAPVVAGLPSSGPWLDWLERAKRVLSYIDAGRSDGARVALGADLTVARALGEFAERAVGVLHEAGFPIGEASRAAGVLVHFVLGRAVEDQTRPAPSEEAAVIASESFPFPLMARGLRERAGSTAEDDFRYALGVLLAGLEVANRGRGG